jgi:hypothetical protein
MASTFAGLSLFNSGPHRFALARCGRLVRGPFETPLDLPNSTDEGRAIELRIQQFGRLIAANSADLWTLIEAIRAEAEARRTGTLIDHNGKQWTAISQVTFEPARRIDRGRVFSVSYRCSYLKF